MPADGNELAGAQYQAADDPVQGDAGFARALAAGPAPGEEVVFAPEAATNGATAAGGVAVAEDAQEPQAPVVKNSMFDRVGRNDPCPCGSGKKFKFCHGR
ncbi:MAG: SEC-C domain-containing protein [Acidimicrobiaceae bacterium]|nr:SEC-C domain-containing protein [Acidimicrobiaceae bacterium]